MPSVCASIGASFSNAALDIICISQLLALDSVPIAISQGTENGIRGMTPLNAHKGKGPFFYMSTLTARGKTTKKRALLKTPLDEKHAFHSSSIGSALRPS